ACARRGGAPHPADGLIGNSSDPLPLEFILPVHIEVQNRILFHGVAEVSVQGLVPGAVPDDVAVDVDGLPADVDPALHFPQAVLDVLELTHRNAVEVAPEDG